MRGQKSRPFTPVYSTWISGYSWLKLLRASRQAWPGAPETTMRPSWWAVATVVSHGEGLAGGAPAAGLGAGGAPALLGACAAGLGAQALTTSSRMARRRPARPPIRARGRRPAVATTR